MFLTLHQGNNILEVLFSVNKAVKLFDFAATIELKYLLFMIPFLSSTFVTYYIDPSKVGLMPGRCGLLKKPLGVH